MQTRPFNVPSLLVATACAGLVALAIACGLDASHHRQYAVHQHVNAVMDGMRTSRLGTLTPIVFCVQAEGRSCGRGSGVSLGNGVVLTADHVLEGALNAFVGTSMKERIPARIVWRAPNSDLALLHAPMFRSAAVPLRCDDAQIGEQVTAMGWPMDLGYAEMQGHVAGLTQRPWRMLGRFGEVVRDYLGGMQAVDFAYGSGMSGGPTIDSNNRLVGINVIAAQGFGGLVPASEVCRVLGRTS